MPAFLAVLAAFVAGFFAIKSKVDDQAIDATQEEITPPSAGDVLPAIVGAAGGAVAGAAATVVQAVTDIGGTLVAGVFGTKYDDLINQAAIANGISPRTFYNLLYAESHFRPDIIEGRTTSPVGAIGIAQFMPATAIEELGSVEAAKDPYQAIPGAARYLAKLIRSTGSIPAGVAAYNWGVGNVKRKGLDKAPNETIKYVSDITGVDISQG